MLPPLSYSHGSAFAIACANFHLIHQAFRSGQTHAQSAARAMALLESFIQIRYARPVVLEAQLDTADFAIS